MTVRLRHGPIDCLCRAWGEPDQVALAYEQARDVFPAILPALCAELPRLRAPLPSLPPQGAVARAMHAACAPYADRFITPMAAVAGAVADAICAAMCDGTVLDRAFVNNGGDIAFHLAPGMRLRCGIVTDLAAPGIDATAELRADHPGRGIATSGRACKGRGGRSFSMGLADAVTVLARDAARADAAATVIANAVDLPGHNGVQRVPADSIDPDSDLGGRLVTADLGPLSADDIAAALDAGARVAEGLIRAGLIDGALLALRGGMRAVGWPLAALSSAGVCA